jgi:hypothetical protein
MSKSAAVPLESEGPFRVDYYLLSKAVAAWVRAEYMFRLGPRAYQDQETDWYLKACDQLRAAATGHEDLGRAARALGVPPTRVRIKARVLLRKD